jgi:hypothetical protein
VQTSETNTTLFAQLVVLCVTLLKAITDPIPARHLRYAQVPGPWRRGSGEAGPGPRRRQKKIKIPLSNGVYSAKNARRDLVIKIQQTEIDVLVCWLASRLSGPEAPKIVHRKFVFLTSGQICILDLWPPKFTRCTSVAHLNPSKIVTGVDDVSVFKPTSLIITASIPF